MGTGSGGGGSDARFVHDEHLAVDVDRVAREQAPDDRQPFVHPSPAGARVDAADLELVRIVAAEPDSEHEPPGCELRERGDLAGHRDRMTQREQVHRRVHG